MVYYHDEPRRSARSVKLLGHAGSVLSARCYQKCYRSPGISVLIICSTNLGTGDAPRPYLRIPGPDGDYKLFSCPALTHGFRSTLLTLHLRSISGLVQSFLGAQTLSSKSWCQPDIDMYNLLSPTPLDLKSRSPSSAKSHSSVHGRITDLRHD